VRRYDSEVWEPKYDLPYKNPRYETKVLIWGAISSEEP